MKKISQEIFGLSFCIQCTLITLRILTVTRYMPFQAKNLIHWYLSTERPRVHHSLITVFQLPAGKATLLFRGSLAQIIGHKPVIKSCFSWEKKRSNERLKHETTFIYRSTGVPRRVCYVVCSKDKRKYSYIIWTIHTTDSVWTEYRNHKWGFLGSKTNWW